MYEARLGSIEITIYDGWIGWCAKISTRLYFGSSRKIFFLGKVRRPWRWKVYCQRFSEKAERQSSMGANGHIEESERRLTSTSERCQMCSWGFEWKHLSLKCEKLSRRRWSGNESCCSGFELHNSTVKWSERNLSSAVRGLAILIYIRNDLSRGLVRNSRGRARCGSKRESLSTRITIQRQSEALKKAFLYLFYYEAALWQEMKAIEPLA